MINIQLISFFVALSIFLSPNYLASQTAIDSSKDEIQSLHEEIKIMKLQLNEIDKDQVDHSIERNELKEFYSSHLQTVDVMLSILGLIILIIGSVIGFFGFKSIKDLRGLKEKYDNQLDEVQSKLKEAESGLSAITLEQTKLIDSINERNEVVDNRLEVEQFKSEIEKAYKELEFSRAHKLINEGLKIDPDNIEFKVRRAATFMGQLLYSDALREYNEVLEINPNYGWAIIEKTELLLFMKNVIQFEEHYLLHKALIDERREGLLSDYFLAFKHFLNDDILSLRELIQTSSENLLPGGRKQFEWGFYDAFRFLQREDLSEIKKLFQSYIEVLAGSYNLDEFKRKNEIL